MKRTKPLPRSTKPIKRTPLKRGTKPLPEGKPPKRGKPPRKVDPKRKAARFERDYGGAEYVEWLTAHPCAVSDIVTGEVIWCSTDGSVRIAKIVAAHVKGRGAGGRAEDQVPMEDGIHREFHAKGQHTTARKYSTTVEALREKARAYRAEWEALHA